MKIIEDKDLPIEGKNIVIIGNFDGVHIGHRMLIREAVRWGEKEMLPVIAWTFGKHPAEFSGNHKYISSGEDKLAFFEEEGVSGAYFADFEKYRNFEREEFAKEVLASKFNAKCVVCGFNFTYGKNKSGNAETLKESLSEMGVECVILPPVYVDGEVVSSSLVKKCIAEGNVEKAKKLLCRPYSFSGVVVRGKANGRKIGFPTANVEMPLWMETPKFGVYVSVCNIDGKEYKGVSNIGIRPTVEEEKKVLLCETYLLGENLDLYGKSITVSLLSMIREERKFEGFDELAKQLKKDTISAERFFDGSGE